MILLPITLYAIIGCTAATAVLNIRNTAQIEAALADITVTNIDDVRGNIFLPSVIDGLAITWLSSNLSVVRADGVVNRQTVDTVVTLTASISDNGDSVERLFNATVRQAVTLGPLEAYLFAYFTGDTIAGENIYFAASEGNDALNWTELNGGKPVITSTMGTKGLRDPFIIRSPEGDTFYLLATEYVIFNENNTFLKKHWGFPLFLDEMKNESEAKPQ